MLGLMAQVSPTAEGFRAAFRRPSLTLAEVTWRWVVGATAIALSILALIEYLDNLPVTNGEVLFLRTKQPFLVGHAIAHILRGTLNRAALAFLLASLASCGLWIVAAAIGRAVTVRELLAHFAAGGDVVSDISSRSSSPFPMRALIRLNFLRAALALAAIWGLVGAAILASFASPDANPQPALVFFLFLPLAGLVCWVWWALNWFLSVAGVFAVRDGEDAVGAISAAVAFCRERTGPVFAVSIWTILAHLAVFMSAATVVSMFLGMAAVVRWRLVAAGMILVTLAYLAVADWLYIARLAGYVYIAEMPEVLLGPAPLQPIPRFDPPAITIDRDELILSDVPSPVN
jgi:hypothetical protein